LAIFSGPINAIYGETVAGAVVIRAFGTQGVLLRNFLQNQNMYINTNTWRFFISWWFAKGERMVPLDMSQR